MTLSSPWLKRIDVRTGEVTAVPLHDDETFSLGVITPDSIRDDWDTAFRPPPVSFEELVQCEGESWFHITAGGKRWLLHGSVMATASTITVFMEHPEARHPELERALSHDPLAADVYADWLLEQGDPFGAALKPQVAKERGPAGLWWLEGFERNGVLTTTVRDGFVREATLGLRNRSELEVTLHRLCHLRALVALEQLTVSLHVADDDDWNQWLDHQGWAQCQWPASLKRLAFTPAPPAEKLAAFSSRLRQRFPGLVVAG